MEQKVRIKVSKKPPEGGGVVSYKTKHLKRGLLKRLLGIEPDRVTIIVPGPDVSDVEILTMPKKTEGNQNG